MAQQALLIDALNQYWRPAFMAAQDQMSRDIYLALIKGSDALSDSRYFVLLYGFALGSILFGLAMRKEQGMAKWIGYSYLFIGVLSICAFASYYLAADFLSAGVAWSYRWIYPALQPLVRIATGVWLLSWMKSPARHRAIQDN